MIFKRNTVIFSSTAWLLCCIGVASAHPIAFSDRHEVSRAVVTEGSVAKGRIWAPLCMSCHGAHGISTNQIYPNLAGQKETYLINALHEYKDGMRKNPMMVAMAAPLTSQVIADLAAFFSSLNPGDRPSESAVITHAPDTRSSAVIKHW